MALQVCFHPLYPTHHHHQYHRHLHRKEKRPPPLIIPHASSPTQNCILDANLRKRTLNFSILTLLLNGFLPINSNAAMEELERYTDNKDGFTLLIPSSYIKVDKAGATALFEDSKKRSNNFGVVVNPVRLASLEQFGTPQFVADKVIQAEKRKESTKDAELTNTAERTGKGGLQVYEFEYKVDSTRGGMKRIFSAVFVVSNKLYLLNVTHSDSLESPLDMDTRMMLEQVVHSFDAC